VPVYVFIGGAIVAPIALRVKEDVVIGSSVVASVAVIVALGLVVGISVAIIVIITMRRLPRVYALASLFSLAEGVFASFAL
jgi:hypothetical protein